MEKLVLTNRTTFGKKVKYLLEAGTLPAAAYGPRLESATVEVNYKEFEGIFKKSGHSKLINIEVDGKFHKALIKEVQKHPVTRKYKHASFYAVDMEKELVTDVPLEIVGTALAVKNNFGFLEVPSNFITIRCLPGNLPGNIIVDVSELAQVGDGITISQLNLGEGVQVFGHTDEHTRVVFISPPQKEVEEEAPVVAAAEAAPAADAAAPAAE